MNKKVIFINNVGSASLVPELLSGTGYRVVTALDAETGLRHLEAQSYDMTILLENPLAASWVLCEKIRRLSAAPLIVISFNASTETCVKSISAGADYFMRKPFGPLELLARVNSLFQRTLYRQAVPLVS
jgi:DNA-binding response OmpR family regulator